MGFTFLARASMPPSRISRYKKDSCGAAHGARVRHALATNRADRRWKRLAPLTTYLTTSLLFTRHGHGHYLPHCLSEGGGREGSLLITAISLCAHTVASHGPSLCSWHTVYCAHILQAVEKEEGHAGGARALHAGVALHASALSKDRDRAVHLHAILPDSPAPPTTCLTHLLLGACSCHLPAPFHIPL